MSNNQGRFVSLHNHTELGSPLDGMNDVEDLFIRAKEVDHPAVAVTDHGTMTAIYDSWKASKKHGVKLIPGMESYFTPDLTQKKNYHLVLLAKNEEGYRNLLRLNYESYRNQVSGYMGKKTPRISWEHIKSFNNGIIALTACSNGLIGKTLITDEDEEQAICYIEQFKGIFGENLFLEIQPHALHAVNKNGKEVNQVKLNESLIRLSHDMDIPYVITCDAHYRDKDHAKYHDFMLAIKDKKPFDDPNRFRYGVQDMYLKTHEEIIDFFGNDVAEIGMNNSMKIMEACEVPNYLEPSGAILPKFPVERQDDYQSFKQWHVLSNPDVEEDKSYLRYKCVEGFKEKLKDFNPEDKKSYWERVKKELKVLEDKDFSSYMLIVSDYVNWAKKIGMACGPGRGSGAGSLVSYLTGITTVDPIEHGLIFERFHNDQKKSFPDIDSDFADPSKVKDYLKEKYGEDRVASISNWSTLSPKVIIKDAAKSLRLGGDTSSAFKIANHITSIMPDEKTIEKAMKASKEFESYMKKYPELYEYATKLQGLTRNWSVHAAGVVISDRPIYEVAPLRIDPDSGLVITQWEKTRCEENGLVKMDLLGLKTLTVMDDAFDLIENVRGIDINIEDIPLDDPDTFGMIERGETAGVFQLESSLTPLCMRIKPKSIEEISDINALGRPSCSAEQRNSYINRRFGKEKISYIHKTLENSLKKTYGISLYEEGMMTIAKDCAGWDLNEADNLRKITKLKGKDPQLVDATREKFIDDCINVSGMSRREAATVWDEEIAPFGLYGFNKSLLTSEKLSVIPPGSSEWVTVTLGDVEAGSHIRSRDESSGEDIIVLIKDKHDHGILEVYEVELQTGEQVRCTMNHKFRVTTGEMVPLHEIINEGLEIVTFKKELDKDILSGDNVSKIKSVNSIGIHQTYDLEIDHPDHQFYLANGILTSNSHSISYSHISYYTAWLRCHYPTEFMCALLNSEDPNSNKALEYINACSDMDIIIKPPDINLSEGNYIVSGDKEITTGITAIKGVGQKAIDEILNLKPFSSLEDFFDRTNSRIINKRVIQSLAMSGAFSTFGRKRKDIFDNYDKYRTKVNNVKKKQKNIDGFSLPEYHDNEWDRKEFLLNERSVLGRTISGSLHEVFPGFFKQGNSLATSLRNVESINVGQRVRIEGIISSKLKEFTIKKGKNIGKKFAKYLIEDAFGSTAEMTVWQSEYEQYSSVLKDGTPFKAICKVGEYMEKKDLSLYSLESVLGSNK